MSFANNTVRVRTGGTILAQYSLFARSQFARTRSVFLFPLIAAFVVFASLAFFTIVPGLTRTGMGMTVTIRSLTTGRTRRVSIRVGFGL